MMHSNNLVAVIRTKDGKVCREHKDETGVCVQLPFGTEYSILLKNLGTTKAVASISIDGTDVLGGSQVIIHPNSETEVEGVLDPSKNVSHNRFKFIEKTDDIREVRGDRVCDGLVRVEFQFEKPRPEPEPYVPYRPWRVPRGKKWPQPDYPPYPQPIWCDSSAQPLTYGSGGCEAQSFNCCVGSPDAPTSGVLRSAGLHTKGIANDQGITVAGSVVDQKWSNGYVGDLYETKHAIVIQLRGEKKSGAKVVQPVLARSPVVCPTCRRSNKSSNDFCSKCGTCLV